MSEYKALFIQGYNNFRKDRNKFSGGEARYILDHTPEKLGKIWVTMVKKRYTSFKAVAGWL